MKTTVSFFSLLLTFAVFSTTDAAKPNVLLICVDDLKPALGCYGDVSAKTPCLDRLATRGMIFDKAFCNQAVCSPSRNALLTSMRPQSLGIYDLATNFRKAAPDAITLPQLFKNAGYRTAGFGKIFHTAHGNVNDSVSWSEPHFNSALPNYAVPENNLASHALQARGETQARSEPTENADVPDNQYKDGAIADEVIRRLQAASQGLNEPIFLAVGFSRPHLPFNAPKKYWDLYDPWLLPQPALGSPPLDAPTIAPTNWGELRNYQGMPKNGALTTDQQRHLIHGYYAATSYVDAQIGRVLEALDASGLANNTIVVVWGDHGWHLGDHGMWCKHSNYEQAARIPLLVVAPGITKANSRSLSLIETVDIYPTLAELAGLVISDKLDGRSFANVLRDASAMHRDHAIHVYPRGERIGRAVRTSRYRLVEWKIPNAAPESAILELYDYQTDPAESKNVASQSPEVVAALRQQLLQHPEAKPQIQNKP